MTQPDLRAVRISFLSAQQQLRQLQQFPAALLNLATFRFVDAEGHANIDQALDLMERDIATLRTTLQNYRATLPAFDTALER